MLRLIKPHLCKKMFQVKQNCVNFLVCSSSQTKSDQLLKQNTVNCAMQALKATMSTVEN